MISLHYINGYSQKEIATLLQLPITTIKKRLYDARINLKRHLSLMNNETNLSQNKNENAVRIAFYIALRANDFTTIKKHLHSHPELVNKLTEWTIASDTYYWPLGISPLNWAAGVGQIELAKIFLTHNAPINGTPNEPFSPLHHAILMEQTDMIQFLIDSGADINQKATNGLSPLHFSVLRENIHIAQQLINAGASPNTADNSNLSAADWAQQKKLWEFQSVFELAQINKQDSPTTNAPNVRYIPPIEELIGRTINSQGQPLDKRPLNKAHKQAIPTITPHNAVLETGVKVIDLCMPIKRGGFAAVFTPLSGVGRLMIQAQLMHSIVHNYDGYIIFLGLEHGENSAQALKREWLAEFNLPQKVLAEKFILIFEQNDASITTKQHVAETGRAIAEQLWLDGKEVLIVVDQSLSSIECITDYLCRYPTMSSVAAITTLFDGDHTIGLEPVAFSNLDTYITFTYSQALADMWPAIDILASKVSDQWLSQMPDSQRKLTTEARNLLRRYRGLQYQFEKRGEAGLFYLTNAPQEVQNAVRGQRLDHFMTQILPVNELKTGRLGQLVPTAKTLTGAQAILDGKFDTVSHEKLKFVGEI